MSNVAARFVVSPSSPIETQFKVNVQSNDHNVLQNRDLPDQHPISAITGLQEALDNIPDDYVTDAELEAALLEKQDVISDLTTIRSGAALGATALQPNDNISELQNDVGYITGITSSDVTTALGYTPYDSSNPQGYTSNVGTVTSVNNVSPVSGNVTLSIPSATSDLTNDSGYITSSALSPYALSSSLATVATSGDYDDLTNKPTIPAAQVNSDWNASSGVAEILNKPTLGTMAAESASDYTPTVSLATVATSGAYSDLSGTPTIPTVNNATLTITQGGVSKGTFTANASSDVTIALDAGGGGSSYTAGTGIDITNNVISVDNTIAFKSDIPTDTSDLTNSAGYITSSALSGYQTTSNLVTSVSSSSTDSQYPSAKLFYDTCGDIETLINAL